MRAIAVGFCLLLALPVRAGDAEDLALGRARLSVAWTVLEVQARYLSRATPETAFGPEVACALARAQLLLDRPAAARATLRRPRVAARSDAATWTARLALLAAVADGEPLDDGPGPLAAERAFWLLREGEVLPTLAGNAGAQAACVLLRAGQLKRGAALVAGLRTDEPPRSIELDLGDEEDDDPDAPLVTDIALWAPEVWLARAWLPLARAARSADPAIAWQARASMGEPLASIAVEAPGPWSQASRIARLELSVEAALVGPAGEDPPAAVRRALAECAAFLGEPTLELRLRQGVLERLRRAGGVAGQTVVDGGGSAALRTIELSRFAELCGPDVERLGAAYLACALSARHARLRRWYGRRALLVLDERFARARRGNLWEFDLRFLADLGRAYLEGGRYDQLVGYLYRRRTVPELAAAALAVRSMARELQAFQAFDRQRAVVARADDGPAPRREQLLFGTDDPTPVLEVVRDPVRSGTPAVGEGSGSAAVEVTPEGARRWWVWLGGLLALYAGVWLRRWRLLRRYDF